MEIESVLAILCTLPHRGAVKVKYNRKRAFVAYVVRECGIVVGVESEHLTIPIHVLAGVQRIEKIEKAYPWA